MKDRLEEGTEALPYSWSSKVGLDRNVYATEERKGRDASQDRRFEGHYFNGGESEFIPQDH
jgi:hypothetical protein